MRLVKSTTVVLIVIALNVAVQVAWINSVYAQPGPTPTSTAIATPTLTPTFTPTPTPTLTATPAPTPTPALSPSTLVAGLTDLSFWVILLVTALFGTLGGLVYELLILQGNIELPHKPAGDELTDKYPYAIVGNLQDWGIFARLILGATAAIAALLVLSPQTPVGLIATALVAGSVGTSVFRSLQDRILAALAIKEVNDTKAASAKAQEKVEQAQQALDQLKTAAGAGAAGGAGTGVEPLGPESAPAAAATVQNSIDEVARLLSEAKGLHEGINK